MEAAKMSLEEWWNAIDDLEKTRDLLNRYISLKKKMGMVKEAEELLKKWRSQEAWLCLLSLSSLFNIEEVEGDLK